ncbi:MAG: hypothetical protein ACXVDC_16860 [Bacteroidia bacterium]
MENLDIKTLNSVSQNIYQLMNQVLNDMDALKKNSLNLRMRISTEIKSLTNGLSQQDQTMFLNKIAGSVQEHFNNVAPLAKAKIKVTGNCCGQSGGSISIENSAGVSVGVCVTGSLSGITGGGVQGGWTY